jgi:hypothetical protein
MTDYIHGEFEALGHGFVGEHGVLKRAHCGSGCDLLQACARIDEQFVDSRFHMVGSDLVKWNLETDGQKRV